MSSVLTGEKEEVTKDPQRKRQSSGKVYIEEVETTQSDGDDAHTGCITEDDEKGLLSLDSAMLRYLIFISGQQRAVKSFEIGR